MNPEEIFKNCYKEFRCEDPYNDNVVEGYISNLSTDLYGALLITKVNDAECPQLIRCTPKIKYPFGKNGNYCFPKAVSIEQYEKLDGTNIFSYRYHDAKGNIFVSFKTRLTPSVQNSKFGPFREMLAEIMEDIPEILTLPRVLEADISYELWGARNPHLIKYEKSLDLSVLFVRRDGKILPPSALPFDHTDLSVAKLRGGILGNVKLEDSYNASRKTMERTIEDTGDGYYCGCEGEVWYMLTDDGNWQQLKCKPSQIELIHWSQGGISKNIIIATCENAFENWDLPTTDNIRALLLEEFSETSVEKVHYRISKCLEEVIQKHEFREKVMEEYRQLGMSILTDRGNVMRALSSRFPRKDMRSVFGVIWSEETK